MRDSSCEVVRATLWFKVSKVFLETENRRLAEPRTLLAFPTQSYMLVWVLVLDIYFSRIPVKSTTVTSVSRHGVNEPIHLLTSFKRVMLWPRTLRLVSHNHPGLKRWHRGNWSRVFRKGGPRYVRMVEIALVADPTELMGSERRSFAVVGGGRRMRYGPVADLIHWRRPR